MNALNSDVLTIEQLPGPIYVIDDDRPYRERLGKSLRARGFEVVIVDEPVTILDKGLPSSEGCAIVDLRMPTVSGLEIVSAISFHNPAVRAIVVTGYGSIATAVEAMRRGAVSYVTKPISVADMLAALRGETTDAAPPHSDSATSLAQVEWEHIHAVLNRFNGNITRAAQQLGIHRRSLQRKLKEPPC